jgi:hypothetical protein
MARGPSGKLVIEVDPTLKDELHARLAAEKKTMKEWFIEQARQYLRGQQVLPLSDAAYPTRAPTVLKAADSATNPSYGTRRSS